MIKTKIFELGNIDYTGTGIANNPVTVEVSLETEDDKKTFSVCGNIWYPHRRDILCGGQCLDTIAEYITDDELFTEIYRLWKLYHLNDMHAECIHQYELGWTKEINKEVIVSRYILNTQTWRHQEKIKEKIIDNAKKNIFEKLNNEDLKILNLNISRTVYDDASDEELKQYYELDRKETKRRIDIDYKTNPIGLIRKPCPVCGYQYGTSWNYFPIPEEDEKIINKILSIK